MSQPFKKASADFLIITDDNAEGSYTVDQEDGAASVESVTSWFPEECHSPTSHVYVMTEADGMNLFSQILTGDDWRHLEDNDLLQPFTDQILAGAEPQAVMSMLRDRGHPANC
jgi:hypothetical protein